MDERRFQKRIVFLIAYLVFAILPVYWMVNMSFKTNEEILSTFSLWPQDFTLDHYKTIFTDESLVLGLHQLADLRGHQHGDLARWWRCRRPMPSPATASSATSMCSSGC